MAQQFTGNVGPPADLAHLVCVPPKPRHPVVGRNQAVADLRARLVEGERTAITALQGLPGVGKTTLAIALAHDPGVRRHFTGGVYWAALGPQGDAEGALNRWATALEVEIGGARDAQEKAQRLALVMERAALGAPVLLVLDDVWRLEDAKSFDSIAFPGCVEVCTTRDAAVARKFSGRAPWVVRELSDDEAERLLAERCPEAKQADPEGLRALATAVGGLPLGLTLIAGALVEDAGQPRWVRKAIERLRDTEARLLLSGAEQEGTLRAILEMSVTALAPEVQGAFAMLGAFAAKPAHFGTEAALSVWEVGEDKGDGWLKLLVNRGVLETAGEDRFAVHPVLGDLAGVRLGKEDGVRWKHANYYRDLVHKDPRNWRWIEGEMEQIRRGWAWTSRDSSEEALVIIYCHALQDFFERRGLPRERLAWTGRALEAAVGLKRSDDETALLNCIGEAYDDIRNKDRALAHFERALTICRNVGDRRSEARTINNIGKVYYDSGDKDRAREYFEQALPIRRTVVDAAGEATSLNNVGKVYSDLGDHERGREYLERALAIWREVGDHGGEARILHNLGVIYSRLGDQTLGLQYLEQALPYWREVGDRPGEAGTLGHISRMKADLGERTEAIALLEQALQIEEELQHPDLASDRAYLEWLRAWQRSSILEQPTTTKTAPEAAAAPIAGAASMGAAALRPAPVPSPPPPSPTPSNPMSDQPVAPAAPQPAHLGIVVALQEEFRELLALSGSYTTQTDAVLTSYRFERGPYRIVAAFVGDMGEVQATRVTERLITLWEPAGVAVVGIAAGVHDDLRVGDVYVPPQAVQYLQDAKASPKKNDPAEYSFVPGAPAYRADHTLLDAVRHLEFGHPDVYGRWRADCGADLSTLLPDAQARERLFSVDLVRREVQLLADGHVATGPVVGAAPAFSAWIRTHDRNVKALEMESAAVLLAAQTRGTPTRAFAIRGISDYGDDRKKDLDAIGKGALRKYAMRNAVRLLWALLEAEALPRNPR